MPPGIALPAGLVGIQSVLGWVAFSSTYVSFPDMILLGTCQNIGIPTGHCNRDHPQFTTAQADQARFCALYLLLTNVPTACLTSLYSHLSDVHGRKPFLIISALFGVAVGILIAWDGLQHGAVVAVVVVLSTLTNIYVANGISFAAIADITMEWSSDERTRLFSRLEACAWLGQWIGPFSGGAAANLLGPQKSFLLPAITSLCILLLMPFFPETLARDQRSPFSWQKANPFGGMLKAFQYPTCIMLATGMLFAQWAISSGVTTWPLFCKSSFNWSDEKIGLMESIFFAANTAGLFLWMPFLIKHVSPKAIIILAVVHALLMWSFFGLAARDWQMFAITSLGMGNAMMYPIVRTSLVTAFGPQLHGLAIGLVSLVEMICQAGAPATANAIWSQIKVHSWPDHVAYGIVAAFVVVALLIFAAVPSRMINTKPQRTCTEPLSGSRCGDPEHATSEEHY